MKHTDKAIRGKLSAWIREKQELERDRPEILSHNLESILNSIPDHSVAQKQRILLHALSRRVRNPAGVAKLELDTAFPVAWAANGPELRYLAGALHDRGLIQCRDIRADRAIACQITPDGWGELDEGESTLVTNQVFVAMWFDPKMNEAWVEGIEPALKSTGHRGLRADQEPHIERIDVKILADIKDSRFIVADVTGHRPGVYFEAGYAMGLGKPVVWSVHTDHLTELVEKGFDTRQFNHIVWADAPDLRRKLENTVVAVIGRGS